MRRSRFFKHIPTSQSIQENRFLKPFSCYLHHHFLWQFNRRGVAGGLAVGLFVGILIPFAQILFGTIGAILVRVNLPVAAFATFVTNPFTVPPLYYAAYRLGNFLIGSDQVAAGAPGTGMFDKVVNEQGEVSHWFDNLIAWVQTVGPEFMAGLAIIAVVSALAGYVMVNVVWHLQARYRWHKRSSRKLAD
ncbi:DUF2062 domain-containing protein [Herminiimonas fonticola]|uniref:DUF2062 domain-containing protein n=1 Tax=Herminiimonas fonticola TaxID=303380 RepID=UPI00334104B9